MNKAIAVIQNAVGFPPVKADLLKLKVLAQVPTGCGVAVLAGAVIVYDEGDVQSLDQGWLYVIEHQRMPAGMHRQTYHEQSLEHLRRREHAIQVETKREVVRVERSALNPEYWQYTKASGHTEGPLYEWGLMTMIVGRVVGFYDPSASTSRKSA